MASAFLVPNAPARAQGKSAQAHFARALELHQSGDLEGAIRAYQACLETEPNRIEALSNLGVAYARLGRLAEAIEQYERALSLDADNAAIRFNLGVARYKTAQIGSAADEFAAVLRAQPDNLNAALLLGECYLQMGQHKQAIALLSPWEASHGEDRALLYVLGTALIRDKQIGRGQALVDRILRDGDSAEARLILGTAYNTGRDYRGAMKEFERAIQLNPNLPTAHAYFARALMAMGERDRAMEEFRRELEINPLDFHANLYLGIMQKQEQKHEEALQYFQRALQVRPGTPEALYQVGVVHLSAGNPAEAQRVLEQVVKDAPDFVEGHVSLATAYYRLKRKEDGDRHRAIVKKLNAEKQAREPGAQQGLATAYRGEALPEMSGVEKPSGSAAVVPVSGAAAPEGPAPAPPPTTPAPTGAAPILPPAEERDKREAVPPAPSASEPAPSFDSLAARAHAAREAERVEDGIGLYQQALDLRPSWPEGWWYLGTLYYGADRYDEARNAFRRLVSLEPKGGAAWGLLGLCEYQLKEYERALEHLQRGRSLGLGKQPQLVQVVRYRTAVLLTRFEHFEAALQILYALAHDRGEHPTVIEALGIASLALPFLPPEVPPEKRELVVKTGKAAYYASARRAEDAERAFQVLLAQHPATSNLHYSYGVFLLISDPDKAIEHFRKELEITPTHLAARLQLAFEFIKRGDWASGLPHAEKSVELSPQSFAAHNALGRILLELGQIERAITELETGVKLAPDSPETRYALARAYARAGRKQDAARERAEFARLDKIRRAQKEPSRPARESARKPEERPPT